MNKNNLRPLVSISCITYNHASFIRECLDGFLMQQCDFDFEVLIHDDASTDGTQEIIKEYQEKYPNIIKPIFQKENQYSKGVRGLMVRFNFPRARGKYIALCEGDDYWTDPLKLQKQVDYMSQNDQCNLVFTDISVKDGLDGQLYPNWAVINKNKFYFEDLIKGNVISTCTVLFKKQNPEILSEWLSNFTIGDYPLYLLLLRSGFAYYIEDKTAVYRRHEKGIFSLKGAEHLINTNIEVLEKMKKLEISGKERSQISKQLANWYYGKMVRMSGSGQFGELREFWLKKIAIRDLLLNPVAFAKSAALFLFPRMKSYAFKSGDKT